MSAWANPPKPGRWPGDDADELFCWLRDWSPPAQAFRLAPHREVIDPPAFKGYLMREVGEGPKCAERNRVLLGTIRLLREVQGGQEEARD